MFFLFAVPPKPPHLLTPVKSVPQLKHGPKVDQTPNRGLNGFTNPSLNCYSPTPVKASFKNREPTKSPQAISYLTPSPTLGSQASNAVVVNENSQTEEAKIPVVNVPKFYCKWSEDVIIDHDHKEEPEEKESVKEEDDPEQKLYKVANEFLQIVKNIFSNISSIFSFHNQFLLPDLENCLGSVLLQHAPFMRMYADYVRNFDQSLDLVRTWTERSSAFRNIIQEIQSMEQCGSLTLQHHMLEPVQRLPRYELLLRDYLKKLPEDHPDYQPAQKSLQIISMATVHSNSAIEKAEGLRKLLEVYEMVGEEEVVNPTNEFLKEGRLVKLAARNTSAMERRLFLFNNFLLCCSPKFSLVGQRYTVRYRIGIDGMNVLPTVNEGHPFTFQVSGKEKTVELQARCEKGAISVFQKKNETFKMAARDLVMKELGRRAPKWIRDNEVTMCMKCNEAFNPLTRRRHHCRACGCVVCWKCSDNKAALEYDGNKLNKVCKSCFHILTAQRGERLRSDVPILPSLISGFLNYGDNPKTWQQTWTVLPKNDPSVLYLYAASQSTIPLLGYMVEKYPQEFPGQVCFCLRQSKITHTFFCEHMDLRDRWVTVLKTAIHNTTLALPSTESCSGNVSDASSSSNEDYLIIDHEA
uniref:FYVE, RhoGEF and PH domain containing 4b n=1 Tax=Periophthalmus magnuspinnatus TaxID=409849 RepID=A0A3B3ZJS4_9GOBI